MPKSKIMIRFWILDDDTGNKKFGSPWFDYDEQKKEIDEWLGEFDKNDRIIEQTKYIKESAK